MTLTLMPKTNVSVLDVARYILKHQGRMSSWKLQKLCYYCQAWSLVWDERPLFKERIQAWANGPVVRELYDAHAGRFEVSVEHIAGGNIRHLDADARETIDSVLKFYGPKDGRWLSELTHKEFPWKSARKGLAVGERSSTVIDHATMAEYYGGLVK
jgi:uncharacterized phage-associated protein